jgi:hypothetical protein
MQPTKNRLVLLLTFAALTTANATDASKANETLLRATSPFEDMVEFALAKNDASITKSLVTADGHAVAVRDALPATASGQFDTLLQAIHKAAAAKHHHALAMSAVEVFRLFIDNLEAGSLKVPKEVSLLDCAGFRLRVLAAAPQPDWSGMRQTVEDAAKWWATTKPKVSDKALRDAFNSTVRGLQQAGQIEHLPMLNFAAQLDLDLVDLLEGYFARKSPR